MISKKRINIKLPISMYYLNNRIPSSQLTFISIPQDKKEGRFTLLRLNLIAKIQGK